jgi:hypothetical protein
MMMCSTAALLLLLLLAAVRADVDARQKTAQNQHVHARRSVLLASHDPIDTVAHSTDLRVVDQLARRWADDVKMPYIVHLKMPVEESRTMLGKGKHKKKKNLFFFFFFFFFFRL